MLYVIAFKIPAANYHKALERFKATGGAPPHKGVKLVARYFYADASGGYTIAESDDPVALARGSKEWADLLEFDVRPVFTDEQAGAVLAP